MQQNVGTDEEKDEFSTPADLNLFVEDLLEQMVGIDDRMLICTTEYEKTRNYNLCHFESDPISSHLFFVHFL